MLVCALGEENFATFDAFAGDGTNFSTHNTHSLLPLSLPALPPLSQPPPAIPARKDLPPHTSLKVEPPQPSRNTGDDDSNFLTPSSDISDFPNVALGSGGKVSSRTNSETPTSSMLFNELVTDSSQTASSYFHYGSAGELAFGEF